MMRIVVGIIAHDDDNGYYQQAQQVWRRYIGLHPQVDAYFLKADHEGMYTQAGERDGGFLDHMARTFYCRYEEPEKIENIIIKTIGFMRRMLQEDASWDVLLRTNLSSVYHWDRLLAFLKKQDLSCKDVLANIVFNRFPTGCGMILTRRAVEAIVTCWDKEDCPVNKTGMDDIILGELLKHEGIPKDRWLHVQYNHVRPNKKIPENGGSDFHLRCRMVCLGNNIEARTTQEIPMMNRWVDIWYGEAASAAT